MADNKCILKKLKLLSGKKHYAYKSETVVQNITAKISILNAKIFSALTLFRVNTPFIGLI